MSEVKVNKISPRTNCGTTTLGDSGDTFTIPTGVTITNSGTAAGFGSTGEVSWDTTVKTGDFTGVSGVGYFINTTGGVVTITLPSSPSAGNVVAVSNYNNSASTNKITVARNGSNIIGAASDFTIAKGNSAVQFIYVDGTVGWQTVFTGTPSDVQNTFVVATGGTITTSGDFKIHTFTGPGTFNVTSAGTSSGSTTVDYMIVAGGGSGGCGRLSATCASGGGGAGGWRASSGTASGSYTAGPGPLTSPVSALPVSVQGYPIVIGAGGASAASTVSNNGSPSSAFGLTSTGGGGGGSGGASQGPPNTPGNPGGSGGGIGGGCGPGGTGNTPPVTPPQGNNGGAGSPANGFGGGGGATAVGGTSSGPAASKAGGAGATSSITASPLAYAGGGGAGGSANSSTGGPASPCGTGGRGGNHPGASPSSPKSGTFRNYQQRRWWRWNGICLYISNIWRRRFRYSNNKV